MSDANASNGKQRQGRDGGDPAHGGNGEGSNSALEAMLKKRQMGVRPPAESGGQPSSQQQDGGKE